MISNTTNNIETFNDRHMADSFRVLAQHNGLPTPHMGSPSISPLIICVLRSTIKCAFSYCLHYAPESSGKSIRRSLVLSNSPGHFHRRDNKNLANPNCSDWRGRIIHLASRLCLRRAAFQKVGDSRHLRGPDARGSAQLGRQIIVSVRPLTYHQSGRGTYLSRHVFGQSGESRCFDQVLACLFPGSSSLSRWVPLNVRSAQPFTRAGRLASWD